MPSTSPYQNNDYQAANSFRPYVLPTNDIFKAVTAQNQFWDDGARRVKSVYDNALDMKLSLAPNKEIRDQFMKDAEKQITKLSSMDLSDPSVQRQGMNIFTPLFKDEGILSDDAATRDIEKTQSQIRSAMTMENGKYYSASNAAVALDGVYDFKNSTDRMAGKAYLANKKDFKPYYDPSKEFTDIVKNCKGPTLNSTRAGENNNMYMHTENISGANASRLSLCLDSGLSQKAKDQIGIDGYAAYLTGNRVDHPDGKNYQALSNDYFASASSTLSSIDQNVKDIDGKILGFKNAYAVTKDAKYLDLQKSAEDIKSSYLDRGKNLKDSLDQVTAGNMDFVKKNYETLAEQIHLSKQVANYAEAFRNDINTDKYSADAVKMQAQNLTFQEAKINAGFLHDEKMAELHHGYRMDEIQLEASLKGTGKAKKLLDSQGNEILTPTDAAYTDADVQKNGYAQFNAEKTVVQSQADGSNLELFNTLKRKYPDEMKNYNDVKDFFTPGTNGISPAMSFADVSGKLHDDPAVTKWASESAVLTNKMSLLNTQDKINQDELSKTHGPLLDRSSIKDIKPITVSNGMTLSAEQVQDALEGKPSPLRIIEGSAGVNMSSASGNVPISSGYVPTEYYLNGVKMDALYGNKDHNLHELVTKVTEVNNERTSKLNAARNEIWGKSLLSIKPTVFGDLNNINDNDPTRNRIAAQFNTKLDNVKILRKDPTTGEATFSIKGTDKEPFDSQDALKRLKNVLNVDESKDFKVMDNEAVFTVKNNRELVDQRTLDNPFTVLQMNLDKIAQTVTDPSSQYAKVQPGQSIIKLPFVTKTVGGNDFLIDVIRTQQGGVKYEVSAKQKKNLLGTDGTIRQEKGKYYPTQQSFNSTNELLAFLNRTQ